MAFALSGSIITQSGTDANPSVLGAIAGVTTQSFGTGSRIRTIYTIPAGRQLAITGTLTHDTDQYLILFSDNAANTGSLTKVLITGVYNYGIKANGQPSRLSGISIPVDPGTWWAPSIVASGTNGNAILVNGSGARFNMQGGQIDGALTIGFGNGAGGTISGGTVVVRDDAITNGTNWLTRILTPNLAFNGYTMIGGSLSIGANTAGQTFSISRPGAGGVAYWLQTQSATPTRIKDYVVGAGYDVGVAPYSDGVGGVTCVPTISQNSAAGTAVNVRGGEPAPSGDIANAGYHAFLRTISTAITTESGLADGFIYVKDTNNGQRKNLNAIDDTPDKVYIGTITSGALSAWSKIGGGGLVYANNYEIISGIVNVVRDATNTRGISNQGIWRKDLRGLSDVEGEDRFNFYVWSYANQYKVINQSLAGAGTLVLTDKVFIDSGVTLSSSAALAKLASSFTINTSTNTLTVTASSTLDDVYDALKAYKCQAIQANLEYPTISTQPATASGTTVITAMDVVVNSGVTLSSGAKFTSLSTSGTFASTGVIATAVVGSVTTTGTFAGGASVTGNVTQATPTALTSVNITGNLTYNSAAATVTLANCNISGTISNSGAGTVTTRLAGDTTIGTVGSNVVAQLVTALTLTGLTAGSAIYVADANGDQVAYVASSGASYSLDTTGMGALSWTVARYGYLAQSGSHNAATTSTTAAISLAVDAFITQADPTIVAAYSALSNPDRIYDFGAYFETTNAGIAMARVASKAASQVSLGSYPLILNASGAAWGLASGTLTLNISTSFVAGVTMTGGLVTTGAITLNAQATAAGSWGSISGGSIALAGGINYQPLVATTAITGLPTSGAISGGGSIAFGSGTTYAPTANFTASGTAFSGTLNVSAAASRTFTATDVTGSQFYVNATGAGAVKILRAGTTTTAAFTIGSNVTIRQNITIATLDSIPLSTYVIKNGTTVLGWQALTAARTLEVADTDTFSIYAAAYGYKPKIISALGSSASSFVVLLAPETNVDTSLPTATRNTIAAVFSSSADSFSRLVLSVSSDLRAYSPDEVLNGMHYYTVTQGAIIAASALTAGSVSGFDLMDGGLVIGTAGFYGKVADSVTTTTDLGILIPIAINVLSSVYVTDPTYTPVRKNTSGIVLQYAPWTKQAADISALDKADIRDGLALESTLALKADQATVAAIPTNPLLTTDTRLSRLDVNVSSRLAAADFSSSAAPTSTEVAAAVRTELATELGRIDAAVTSRLAAASYTAPGTAPTSAQNAQAVRAELAAELARIDAAVSSRLAASGYTAPGPVPTSAQNAAAVRTELALELARLDAAVSSRLAASAYTAPGTAPTSAEVAAAVRAELAAELARLDVASSTRLAASAYTAPDNASITAIKNNTGLIPALF